MSKTVICSICNSKLKEDSFAEHAKNHWKENEAIAYFRYAEPQYSPKQLDALEQIGALEEHFGVGRWFTQGELLNMTAHTMNALVEKGDLEEQNYKELSYYRIIKKYGDST